MLRTTKNLMVIAMLCLPAFAFAGTGWGCEGDNIEGLGVSNSGTLTGSVAWDCFPGGGICSHHAAVEQKTSRGEGGATIFSGNQFTLTIETDSRAQDGKFAAHISAVADGPQDMGGGMSIDEDVTCSVR